MGWVEAVVAVLTSWAWPLVVLVAVLILRKELGALLKRMSRLTAPGVEAEFGANVDATAQLAEASLPDPPSELPEQPTLAELEAEARRHTVGAIVRAWNMVEGLVSVPLERLTWGDLESARITWETLSVYQRLRDLRNQVVHGRVIPSVSEAEEFVSAAWRLAASLNEVKAQSPDRTRSKSS